MKHCGLPKSCLLRKGGEFEQVYKKGKRLYGEGFTMIHTPNDLGYNRLGLSIHRRIKGAVKRNRIKRIIRESFRLRRDVFPQDEDIVFAVKPGFSIDSPDGVTQAVSFLSQAGDVADDK